MATVNCSCSSNQIQIEKYGSSFLKYPNKELLFKCKRSSSVALPLKRAAAIIIQRRRRRITVASIRNNNKVYEDKSEGIVCYQDEHGEIICEGYDEGPSFQRLPNPITSYHHPSPRDAEMTNVVIPQGWLKIESNQEEADLNSSCNGFNSFR